MSTDNLLHSQMSSGGAGLTPPARYFHPTSFLPNAFSLEKDFLCLNGNRVLSSHEMELHLEVNQRSSLRMMKKVAREIYIGGEKRLVKIIGTSKRVFIRWKRKPYKRSGKPVIT